MSNDFKVKSETVVQAQKAVDDYNTNTEAVKKAQAGVMNIGAQIDALKDVKKLVNEKSQFFERTNHSIERNFNRKES